MRKWLFICLALLCCANASESACEKLKEKELLQNYLLTEFFSNLSEYSDYYGTNLRLGLNIYTKTISANEDTTICAFYSKLRFSDTQLTNEDIKSIKEAFAKRGDFATYEENEKQILHYAKLAKYNNKPLESVLDLLNNKEVVFNDMVKYDGLLQIHIFKMGYLQKESAGGYSAPQQAIYKGEEFLHSKEGEEIKEWINGIDSAK